MNGARVVDRQPAIRRAQKDGFRHIDDCSDSIVNACTICDDKVAVAGLDASVGFAKLWADKIEEARSSRGWFAIILASGEVLIGRAHEDFNGDGGRFVGKCLDLGLVCKQCPIAPSHSHLAIIATKNPRTGVVEFFEATALPFGAVAAVHGFNRVAMVSDHLVHACFGVFCTHIISMISRLSAPRLLPRMLTWRRSGCSASWVSPSRCLRMSPSARDFKFLK